MRHAFVAFVVWSGLLVHASLADDVCYRFVDLQPYANQRLDEDFLPGNYPGDSLSEIPRGFKKLGGVEFVIGEALLQVAGKFLPDHPERIKDIEVGRPLHKLHFLHAARWGAFGRRGDGMGHYVPDGTPIGYYEVVYADNHAEAIPIVYGVDVRDWWSVWDNSKPVKRGTVVWTGNNRHLRGRSEANHTENPLRLYLTTWENPRPEIEIESIEFVSVKQTATPFCVAITSESSNLAYRQSIRKLRTEVEQLKARQAELEEQLRQKDIP